METKKQQNTVTDISEQLPPARRRDLSFYIVLFVAVIPLWSVIPLSWAYVIYALRSGNIWTFAWCGRALFAAALCEVFFSVYHYNLTSFITGPHSLPPNKLSELQKAFTRVLQSGLADLPEDGFDEESLDVDRPGSPAEEIITLQYDDPRAADFRNNLRTWFNKAPFSAIHKHEMYTWLYWSIFNAAYTSFDDLPPAHQVALKEVCQLLEARAGCKIPEGSNASVRPLLLTLDPVNVVWRPFFWYVGIAISNFILRRRLAGKWGVKYGTYHGLEYMLRVPAAWDPLTGPRPVVFLHGLGLGVTQYNRFLNKLFSMVPDHPVLVPLQPYVSQQIFHPRYLRPMGRRDMARTLAGLLDVLGWAKWEKDEQEAVTSGEKGEEVPMGVTMLSHSNGSFAHAWMLKHHPSMVTRSCFIDPVTFCSWEGDLCYNFIYRPCTTGMELVIKYFVGCELGVANFLQRHFDWYANSLWHEEIPNARDPFKTKFFLGGKDVIVNAERVKRYLTAHGIRKGLWYNPNGRHGQAMLSGTPGQKEIFKWLLQTENASS
ncbi:uncharacterized protein LAESUDRAFT_668166 [Laetiporus sulphureus 93-53]|uniref:Alpha/beta-hydrolase n=1 Tax=Laetiporus sulphureus 93-53 TaxID=1314785 RepID=A0A165I1Y5_9APHY|nr:uncharacterized protein LAESUDRAFT_668166 [Laetiporus sulphureus 93-53]KZT12486.1 hypothetical protein LAESUDRAFT_668166 [Laetiporus sulphureus 93-53]